MRTRLFAIAALFTLGAAGLSAQQSSSTMKGFISDSQCGASHSSPSADATKCVQKCIRGGAKPVLVSDGKVYKLKGEDTSIKSMAGKNVTVKGTVQGDTITVVWVSGQRAS